jgi:hypothetical protein
MASLAVAITPQNVSLVERSDNFASHQIVEEDVLRIREDDALPELLLEHGASDEEAQRIARALHANFAFELRRGQKLRLGLGKEADGRIRQIRVSL